MTIKEANKITQETPSTPIISPAIIERTNRTYPDQVDVLTLHNNLDSINISIKTYQQFSPYKHPTLWSDKFSALASQSMELTVEEATILRNKLNEFLSAYEEFSPYNFMAGVHEYESVEKKAQDWLDFLEEYDLKLPGYNEDLPSEPPIKFLHPDLQREYEEQYKEMMEIFNNPKKHEETK